MSKFKKTREPISNEATDIEEKIIHAADDKPKSTPKSEKKADKPVTVSGIISKSDNDMLDKISATEDRSKRKIIGRILSKEINRLASEYGLD